MPLGSWGTELKRIDFKELDYVAKSLVQEHWSYGDLTLDGYTGNDFSETAYKALTDMQRKELEDQFSALATGNCGALADFFLTYGEKLFTDTDPIKHIKTTFEDNVSGIFRITVGDTHTFIGILSNHNPTYQIEILQAWQGLYSVRDWLNKGANVFSKTDFLTALSHLSNVHTYRDASLRLFSSNGEVNPLNAPIKVTRFAFKAYYPEAMGGMLTDLRAFTPGVADCYVWQPA